LAQRYRQLVVRRGKQRAAVAIGHQILVTAYYLLQRQEDYNEVTPAALDGVVWRKGKYCTLRASRLSVRGNVQR